MFFVSEFLRIFLVKWMFFRFSHIRKTLKRILENIIEGKFFFYVWKIKKRFFSIFQEKAYP